MNSSDHIVFKPVDVSLQITEEAVELVLNFESNGLGGHLKNVGFLGFVAFHGKVVFFFEFLTGGGVEGDVGVFKVVNALVAYLVAVAVEGDKGLEVLGTDV